MAKADTFLFKIGYWLYTNTPIGYYYYQRELRKAKEKYPEGHSICLVTKLNDLEILPIPMSDDNYCYLVTDGTTNTSVLVDPANPSVIQPLLEEKNITPTAVLTTHKHWDHSAGNSHWKNTYPDIVIHGGEHDSVPGATHPLADGDTVTYGQMTFTARHTPGHTRGHVVYTLDGAPFNTVGCVFSGDHVFISGCGRFFEASPVKMLSSLDMISTLKDDTLIWPGHEYSKDNLEFAKHIDPENEHVVKKLNDVNILRKERKCTCPSTVGDEKLYNPFLRTSDTSIIQNVGKQAPADASDTELNVFRSEVLAELRARKDKFKYKL